MTTAVIGNNTGNTYSGVDDVYLDETSPTSSQYGSSYIYAGAYSAGNRKHTVVQFTGISNITGPVTVTSATLSLMPVDAAATANYSVYGLKTANILSQETWNDRVTGTAWTSNGGLNSTDANTTALATTAIAAADNFTFKDFTGAGLAALVQDWINGTASNYGLLVARDPDTAYDSLAEIRFRATSNSDGFRPYLTVTYSVASTATSDGWPIGGNVAVGMLLATGGGGGGNVSVTLTGQSLTGTAGTIIPANSLSITGQTVSSTIGTLTYKNTLPLTSQLSTSSKGSLAFLNTISVVGQQVNSSVGTIIPTNTLSLSGQTISSSLGSVLYSNSVGLVSQQLVSSLGTITFAAGGDVNITLSGLNISSSIGTIIPNTGLTLVGQLSTSSNGTIGFGFSSTLSSILSNTSAGTLTVGSSYTLAGQQLTSSVGTIAPSALIGLVGQQSGLTQAAINYTNTLGLVGKQLGVVAGTITYSASGGGAVWPLPSQVAAGVYYGPTGADYLGTNIGNITLEINTGQLIKPLTSKLSIML